MINFKRLDDNAVIPTRGSDEAAGLDLCTIEHAVIPAGQKATLRTGLSMAIPKGTVGLIWPRSKLAAKLGVDVLAGVVDSDYRGEIMICLLNTSDKAVELKVGDKAAQMIIQKHHSDMQIVEVDELDTTARAGEGINSHELRL